MASNFVVTEKRVKTVIDGRGPLDVYMSISMLDKDNLALVIGARFKDRCSYNFNKASLRELVQILEEIHGAM